MLMWMDMDMDMDRFGRFSSSISFLALRGVEIAFLFFSLGWAGLGQKVSKTGVGLVGVHSWKERKGREGQAGVERSRMDQGTELN